LLCVLLMLYDDGYYTIYIIYICVFGEGVREIERDLFRVQTNICMNKQRGWSGGPAAINLLIKHWPIPYIYIYIYTQRVREWCDLRTVYIYYNLRIYIWRWPYITAVLKHLSSDWNRYYIYIIICAIPKDLGGCSTCFHITRPCIY